MTFSFQGAFYCTQIYQYLVL